MATRAVLAPSERTKIVFGRVSAPDPAGGAHDASPSGGARGMRDGAVVDVNFSRYFTHQKSLKSVMYKMRAYRFHPSVRRHSSRVSLLREALRSAWNAQHIAAP